MLEMAQVEKRLADLQQGRTKLEEQLRAARDQVAQLVRALDMQDGAIASLRMLRDEAAADSGPPAVEESGE